MSKIKTLTEIQNETGLSKTIIKSLLVDYNIPSVQLGENKDSLILVNEEQFNKVFTNVNVELRLRTQERRRKSREKSRKWYSENSDSEIEKATERTNKNIIYCIIKKNSTIQSICQGKDNRRGKE